MGLAFNRYGILRDWKNESPAHPKMGRASKWGTTLSDFCIVSITFLRLYIWLNGACRVGIDLHD